MRTVILSRSRLDILVLATLAEWLGHEGDGISKAIQG
jgi:hypothetical protein